MRIITEDMTAAAARALEKRRLAIIGMSPGNSRFNEETIEGILRTAASAFDVIRIMIPDVPATHTYRALGYNKRAESKARLKGNALRNLNERVISSMKSEGYTSDITVIRWNEEITHNAGYEDQSAYLRCLYATNDEFRSDAKDTTGSVLAPKLPSGANIDEAVEEGVKYLLEELAFLTASPKMYGEEHVAYIYHQDWPIFDRLVAGEYDGIRREDISQLIIR